MVCRLEHILAERGMKQKYIIDKLGMNRNTVSAIVRGSKTDVETALRIAELLDLKVEDIWSIDEKNKPMGS